MWAISNQTPFKAERAFVRDAEGAEIWIVAVRGTFVVEAGGEVIVADQQLDVRLAPEYFGEPGKSALKYDMDMVRTKPGTDVVLHAHAHAPDQRPAPFVDVGFEVGALNKHLTVVGNRVWKRGLLGTYPSEPKPFLTLPIRYEFSWGGPLRSGEGRDPGNPVGLGRLAEAGNPVPNIESRGDPIRSPGHTGQAVGFGPIAAEWQPRLKLAGTYDEAWQKERQPLVPRDFQNGYFRCAPVDQQVDGFLHGGEEVVLHNMTPGRLLRFKIPKVSLGFSTRIAGGTTHHRGDIHTVIIEPEQRRLIVVWHTSLPCHHTLYTLKETVVFVKERVPLGAESGVAA